ncbi:phosphorylase family protein [Streptomyces jumonjinensis]|uniref:phosphorylase family protein n=1 Tax=Streptomyces jumonjinensis TaxID=1945 RepID=UPI003792FDD1
MAVVTGDADRLTAFTDVLGTVKNEWRYRELVVQEVLFETVPILVACHGMGGPGAALLAEELIDSGINCIVRVGTCGPLQPDITAGSAVISTGSVRDDGTSRQYLPLEVPALPDHRLVSALHDALDREQVEYRSGLTHCKDAYYCQDPDRVIAQESWHQRWAWLRRLNVLVTEGEAGAICAVAAVRGVSAAAVLVVGGAPRETALANLARCAVAAARAGLALTGRPPVAGGAGKARR